MALAPRIELRQNQSLAMTPQLQQAIKLLQMNNLALAEFVAAEVEKNPMLEIAPPPPRPSSLRGAGDGWDAMEGVAAETGLTGHLHAQIGATRAEARIVAAAHVLVEELEDDGYLRTPLAEIELRHGIAPRDLVRGLALVQSCDPPGVGARRLAECLALQLRDRNRLDPAMQTMIDNLPLLARARMGELQALCGVDDEDMAEMLAEIRALDPKPGLRFAADAAAAVAPDVFVVRAPGGGWSVELNTETLPRVLVDNHYAARFDARDTTTRAFISELRASATWLARSLEQRARTILRVAADLARHQEAFFDAGPDALRPLTQRSVAERLGLHESTVSRVTAGKFVACDRGVFEMRTLFSSAIQAADGGEAFSATAVQSRIRRMISEELPGLPLSDDKIVARLAEAGIEIARRTVAKYREGMGIPSSVERRRKAAVC